MALGTYQLVLSKLQTGGGSSIYKPDIDFRFHANPNDIVYTPRHAVAVKALPTGVHVITAPTRIADIIVHFDMGLAQFLATDGAGNASVMGGRERATELRRFLATVSQRRAAGGYRLEYHDNDRDRHYQVELTASPFSISNGAKSRVGGDEVELRFVVTADLNSPTDVLSRLHAGLAAAQAAVGRVTGVCALGLEVVRSIENVPLQVAGLVTTALSQIGVVVKAAHDVVSGVAEISAIPLNILSSARTLVANIKGTYLAAQDLFTADHWRRMGEALTSLTAELKRLARVWERPGASTTALTASSPSASPAQFSVIASALSGTPTGKQVLAGLANPAISAFKGLDAKLASYTGWTPYVVKAGDTLAGIAANALGGTSDWIILALLNGLSNSFGGDLTEGQILKIPLKNGGLPFGQSQFNDPASFQKAIEEFVYLRDFRLWFPYGQKAGADIEINRDDPRGVRTVTGLANYVQRFAYIVFRTELGSNPCFPAVGVYQGTGHKRISSTRHLTRLSAQAQLWADPRTMGVRLRSEDTSGNATQVTFDVATRLATAKLEV